MKQWQLVLSIVLAGVLILGALILAVPESHGIMAQVGHGLKVLLWDVAFTVVLLGVFLAGPAVIALGYWLLLKAFDEAVEQETEITGWQHALNSILFGIILGMLWMLFIPWVVSWSSGIQFTWELLGADIVYETLPIWWGVWAFILFQVGYWINKMMDY